MHIAPIKAPELIGRLLAEVHAEEAIVDVHQLIAEGAEGIGDRIPVLVDEIGDLNLRIGGGAAGFGGDIARVLRDPVGEARDRVGAEHHHLAQRLTDDGIEREQERERDQRPETAGHGADALFLIELHRLLLQTLLVLGVLLLQSLHFRVESGGAHHALLALGHEGEENDVHQDAEENDGNAIILRKLIEELQRPSEN